MTNREKFEEIFGLNITEIWCTSIETLLHWSESTYINPKLNSVKCDCYHIENTLPVCWGTKEIEPCNCGGNPLKCDFYEYKREQACHG